MVNIFSYDVIAQAIGIVATAFIVGSFLNKRDNHLKGYIMIGNLLFALHFFMIDAFAGMLINIINFFRVGSSIKFHKSTKVMLFFWGAYIIAAIVIYEKPIDLFPVFASMLSTFSMFKLSGIKLRVLAMLGSSSWLIYATFYQSIGGMITETFVMVLNSSTIYRMLKDKKKSNEQNI